jgi:hypothetical protein
MTAHLHLKYAVMSMERYEAQPQNVNQQIAIDVSDMPDEFGKLWDEGAEDHFRGRWFSKGRTYY